MISATPACGASTRPDSPDSGGFRPRATKWLAAEILTAAAGADWAPISHGGVLHDRASYRYFWQLLERAHQTAALPCGRKPWFALPDLKTVANNTWKSRS
jgi:hypothetical protein